MIHIGRIKLFYYYVLYLMFCRYIVRERLGRAERTEVDTCRSRSSWRMYMALATRNYLLHIIVIIIIIIIMAHAFNQTKISCEANQIFKGEGIR